MENGGQENGKELKAIQLGFYIKLSKNLQGITLSLYLIAFIFNS